MLSPLFFSSPPFLFFLEDNSLFDIKFTFSTFPLLQFDLLLYLAKFLVILLSKRQYPSLYTCYPNILCFLLTSLFVLFWSHFISVPLIALTFLSLGDASFDLQLRNTVLLAYINHLDHFLLWFTLFYLV